MTTPYPTAGAPSYGTGDAGPDDARPDHVAGTTTDGTEPPEDGSTPGAPEVHSSTASSAGPGAPEGTEGTDDKTTELDGIAITERLSTKTTTPADVPDHEPTSGAATFSAAPAPAAPEPAPAPAPAEPLSPRRRGARMGTVVWGILLAAIGAGIVARGLGVRFDVELALIVVLCVMGGALLVGSVVAGIRKT